MQKVTAVFDIGRTNKKFFLFDEDFREVYREYVHFDFVTDEDGFPTENLPALQAWLRAVFHRILDARVYDVHSINFSAYGASFVHLDADGQPVTPLYNYEKPLPEELEEQFLAKYGPVDELTLTTGSDPAGMLNSGMQLYWLKYHRPEVFTRIRHSLHLPQYLSYVFTGIPISEYTSIGCHTRLWDFRTGDYHRWVYAEGLHHLLPPIVSTETSINLNYNGKRMRIGVGIHDSSAALLPYIRSERKPFALVSTGTWSVSLNPFVAGALTAEDLTSGCINYMRIDGKPV
ncbi:MAG: FGGY family carbohydrate kinase, partial [Bacteroidota bacterium]